jgi:hypothetical protein
LVAPQEYGTPLRKTLKGYWKLRVGDYRVVYKISRPKNKTGQVHMDRGNLHHRNIHIIGQISRKMHPAHIHFVLPPFLLWLVGYIGGITCF